MLNKFVDTLYSVLRKDERLIADDGTLLKNKAYALAMQIDQTLIKLLLENEDTKKHFFTEVASILVFDKVKFGWVVNNREFLPDSYTRYKNKIGLVDANENIIAKTENVVLAWPYKDCILEGGQSKEDQKRDEIFYNELLAPDDIDRLLFPKVFTNAKKYTTDGVSSVATINDDDNLIVKGNNLLALSSLLKRYEGKVKCIYIDPPYNTGNDSFKYNDKFSRSTWLTFMKNRLELAKKMLSQDGSIFVHLDYNESHYCKVLLDDIFGEENFKNEIIWRRKQATSWGDSKFGIITDSILYYGKSQDTLFNPTYSLDDENTQKYIKERFVYKDEDGELYMKSPLVNSLYRPNLKYVFQGINPPAKGWLYSQVKMQEMFDNNELLIPDDPDARIYRKIYLKNYKGQVIQSLWMDIPIVNPMAGEQEDFQTQKPEKLLQRIISTATNENDLVLDFCMGSGTTCAVAHKMGRQYIGVEQMDYINTVTLNRLVEVINGSQNGISKDVNWQGGGSFVYCELKELNQQYVTKVQDVKNEEDLMTVWTEIANTGFISHYVRPSDIDTSVKEYEELSFENKKKLFLELIDKNMLYVNLCDIDDEKFSVSNDDKAFNRSFYGRG